MEPTFAECFWAFASAIWNSWPTTLPSFALAGALAVAIAKLSARSSLLQASLNFANKPFLLLLCVFSAFGVASFSAFDGEYRAKMAAVGKIQSGSGIVMARDITTGDSYTVGDADYMIVIDIRKKSTFALYLPPNPLEGRKLKMVAPTPA